MGCGSSVATNVAEPESPKIKPAPTKIQKVEPAKAEKAEIQPLEREALQPIKPKDDKSKFVMFEIPMYENQKNLNSNIDTILSKPVQRKSQLEPLSLKPINGTEGSTVPRLPKIGLSRRRSQLMSARRTSRNIMGDEDEEENIPMTAEMLQEKIDHAKRSREAKLMEIQAKQRRREERAKRVREKALLVKKENAENGETLDINNPFPTALTDEKTEDFFDTNKKLTNHSPSSSGYNSREVSASSNANAHHVNFNDDLSYKMNGETIQFNPIQTEEELF